jgi:NAD(P)-dependent dehydrogenase (short-subunit alcohol dehydrogenase family)
MKGHTVLITGGGRGIGEAIARRLSREGARLFITSRTPSDLERVARETGANFDVCDVTDPEQVFRLVKKVGPVQVLVNNAGIAEAAPLVKTDLELWRRILDTNVTSAFLFCKAVVPSMIDRKYGRIVNVASVAGKRGAAYITAYAASKHALIGFNSSLAAELQKYGITVNAVCPGYVDTGMTRHNVTRIAKATGASKKEILVKLMSTAGQTKLLKPEHVAEVALALARPECSHTGAAIDL